MILLSSCLRRLLALLLPAALLSLILFPRSIHGAPAARVLADGRAIPLAGDARTVREALIQARVSLDADDEVEPALEAAVPEGGTIRVRRVRYQEETEELKLPYRTLVRPATRSQRPFHPTVTRPGRSGLKRVTYRVKLVDGREGERTVLTEETVREPVHQIVVSRQPAALGSRGAYTGKRTLTMLATAYDPGAGSCGRYADGKTCNGKRAGYGVIAVDPKIIPLGTKLFIPGYGYGIAADVGGAIKGYRVDLGFNSRSGSLAWGKKWVSVSIVE